MDEQNTITTAGQGAQTSGTGSEGAGALVTDRGKTTIADGVVAKIAGIAAREVSGVHNMGSGSARAVGAIRDRIGEAVGGGPTTGAGGSSPTQGVKVEVGERQTAIDLDLVVEYGVPIADVAESVRSNVATKVGRMTGLEVAEVNVYVDDVWLGESGDQEVTAEPRVQ
ncbi:MAG: Asp23/Gls24 family envelope stress response protein [Actinomycetota bacterium]|nr:Asp23/Gls24 family envelope stress response protein [Actinomycetota bacterium]